jgi:hypothetical protein
MADRASDLRRLYRVLSAIEGQLGGTSKLSSCDGRMSWPKRGVYFLFEPGESRSDSGSGPRVVRVGTHALSATSSTTLWNRLSQHRGTANGGGNHRGSVFRLLIGDALLHRSPEYSNETWGKGSSAPASVRAAESAIETLVSRYIGALPFIWLEVDDPPGPGSLRGFIERNAIALLSNYHRPPLDPPSAQWLGRFCSRERVSRSGLWNNNHVDEDHDPKFLDVMAEWANKVA